MPKYFRLPSFFRYVIVLVMTAPSVAAASGSSGTREIVQLAQRECSGGKDFEITLKTDHQNPDSCVNSRTITVACDHPAYQTMVSMSLTAVASSKPISAYLNGCNFEGKAKAIAMYLKP